MNNSRLSYFEKEDILHLAISEEPEFSSVEISPNGLDHRSGHPLRGNG